MTLTEAVASMQTVVTAAKDRLEGNGFVMSVETDYMDRFFQSVSDLRRARCVTVSLVVSTKDGKKGEEYCMSLGAMITKRGVDEAQLLKDMEEGRAYSKLAGSGDATGPSYGSFIRTFLWFLYYQ